MPEKSIICPVCHIKLSEGSNVCPDCKQDLSALIFLEYQADILYNEGVELVQAGEFDQAEQVLSRAWEIDATNVPVSVVLGKIFIKKNDYSRAKIIWEQALQAHPDVVELQELISLLKIEEVAFIDRENLSQHQISESQRKEKRKKSLILAAQVGFVVIIGFALLWLGKSRILSAPPLASAETLVNVATLEAYKTSVVVTLAASNNANIVTVPTVPAATPTLKKVEAIATPLVVPTVVIPNLLPIVQQAIDRDPDLVRLGLKILQDGYIIRVEGDSPDIRTRYYIEKTLRAIKGVDLVDLSALKVINGDLSGPPSLCTIRTGNLDGKLFMRAGPGIKFGVTAIILEGQSLSILKLGDWYEVLTSDGLSGWVNSYYCPIE
jgi:TolA-binding protein